MRLLPLCALAACAVLTRPVSAIGTALLGIDLGNEYIKVSLVKPGRPFQVCSNYESKRKTPAIMGFYKVCGHATSPLANS